MARGPEWAGRRGGGRRGLVLRRGLQLAHHAAAPRLRPQVRLIGGQCNDCCWVATLCVLPAALRRHPICMPHSTSGDTRPAARTMPTNREQPCSGAEARNATAP